MKLMTILKLSRLFYLLGSFAVIFVLSFESASARPFIVTDLALGVFSNCALSHDEILKCWGWNFQGQLGIGNDRSHGRYQYSMGQNLPPVDLGSDFKIIDFAVGSSETCALSKNGQIKCWGYGERQNVLGHENENGNVGYKPNQMGDNLKITNLGNFLAVGIAVSENHACAWSNNGSAKCWGSNSSGQLGLAIDQYPKHIGTKLDSMGDNLPLLSLPKPVTAMTLGFDFTCAIAASKIYCWGGNSIGQLGIGLKDKFVELDPASDRNAYNQVHLEPESVQIKVIALRSSYMTTCALYQILQNNSTYSKRKLKCWGANLNGELGIGSLKNSVGGSSDEMGAELPEVSLGMSDIEDFSMGSFFSCAKDYQGRIKCWGYNGDGGLGLGDFKNRGRNLLDLDHNLPYVDVGLPVLKLAKSSSEPYHMCVILINHAIKCWGSDSRYGALGAEMNIDSLGGAKNDMGENLPFVKLSL